MSMAATEPPVLFKALASHELPVRRSYCCMFVAAKVGTLTISSATNQDGAGGERINYDPLVMADGIEATDATDDPVLLFRCVII
jgi:hypothetical protein